ncbi:hypothetical protein IRZ71_07590 [Flavobacterium sp. ANB]|uniref:hypothetical protein n=1 Tax=unclassified Flavobacterium TaxID=196869 RepID=UPI0012B7BB07|nr:MULTISPECIES: hypothetical protein [unclassified Flavobacterium]MBF4516198.1 hypothetical protein [Flavobacterium sp. ANB]MTD69905.1 hypothetical protein [Flavobacterium sp. LC2016-13]
MKNPFLIILITTVSFYSQTKVDLRDLTFQVPSEFTQIKKENRELKYDAFYENGKIFIDSSIVEESPLIEYQYFENPGAGAERSQSVLKMLNEITAKDYKCDTLIIDANKNYSLARYNVFGKTIFEAKSLGEKGWINIQLFDNPKNDKSNFQKMLFILGTIKHSGPYGKEYNELMNESGNSSKWAILAFIFFLVVHFLRKLNNKNAA